MSCDPASCDPAARAGAVLDIDLGAIVANWRLLAGAAAPAQCAAVVKANAYGLGAGPVARALAAAGCRLFFVATLDEGIALRRALGERARNRRPERAVSRHRRRIRRARPDPGAQPSRPDRGMGELDMLLRAPRARDGPRPPGRDAATGGRASSAPRPSCMSIPAWRGSG